MSVQNKIKKQKIRRAKSVRARLCQNGLPRVSVFRSLNQIYAQVIDDAQHATVVSFSSLQIKNFEGSKTDVAHEVGKMLAKLSLEKGISRAAFDRGRFLYHGRVKALAEGLREGGLQI